MHFQKAWEGLRGRLCPGGRWQLTVPKWTGLCDRKHATSETTNLKRESCTFRMIAAFLVTMLLLPAALWAQQRETVTGTVTNSNGEPVVNGTVITKQSQTKAETNAEGVFSITVKTFPDTLLITHVGYGTILHPLKAHQVGSLVIILNEAANNLDEALVIAYGKTTRRYNTGSVAAIRAKDIGSQPVLNPLSALSGRMSGVLVSPTNGLSGSQINITIRGRSSLVQGSEPLYIIDGVPLATGNTPINKLSSALTSTTGTGLSPFSTINAADIESIEVLKDADATAIYGSRGANGVVLITTKKGKAGKSRLAADVYRSTSSLTRMMPMVNTKQYVQLRKEAFANDGITPNTTNAPDLLLWDTTRFTDWNKLMYSGNAATVNANISLSGGEQQTHYYVGANYRNEQSIAGNGMGVRRAGASFSFDHNSADNRWNVAASASYTYTKNTLTTTKLGMNSLVPNAPSLFDSTGKLNWQEAGVMFNNPMAYLYNHYAASNGNMMGRMQASYKVMRGLKLSVSTGYNSVKGEETAIRPIAALNPAFNPTGSLDIGNTHMQGWIAEPQADYNTRLWGGKLTVMVGGSWQSNTITGNQVTGSGYTSDNLLGSLAAAPNVSVKRNNESMYRYAAVFGRLNYIYGDRYLLNVSARNDGSSRFGEGRRFSTFAAAGAGWIFSNERLVKQHLPWLSYGKMRASYGTSGNDQIGDYGYMDAWAAAQPYQGVPAIYPTNLANADYRWEVNRKLEAALELGFMKDRMVVSVAWYRNRSSNQLVNYRLPAQAGFTSIIKNLDATVQNTGVEAELTTKVIDGKHFNWQAGFNITVPKNRLLRFPNLSTSTYANSFVIGQPINVICAYRYLGVDNATGVFAFEDVNKDGSYNSADLQVLGHTDPVFYGGLQNTWKYKGLQLDVFVEFRKQKGRNYLHSLYSAYAVPGMMYAMPELILRRWQKPGDIAPMQRLTTSSATAAYKAGTSTLINSDGIYSDASFLRLKNVQVSWSLPAQWMKSVGMQEACVYLQAHNAFTLTKYEGADPEVQSLWSMPPLKTFAMGVRISL